MTVLGPATLLIREARLEDAGRLAQLSAALGYPVTSNAMEVKLRRLLARPDGAVLVAEVESGYVVGWIHGSQQELLESEPRCEILGLVVDAEHRGKGVGRRLVESLEQWARARDLGLMAVRSNVTREESHPFYERLGYVRAKTQHAYRKTLPLTA
jgi:GNAT superfamily N-acetyltransferase